MAETPDTGDKMQGQANRRTAIAAASGAVLMICAAYAAVPLYDLFCRVTGFGGTPQVAEAAPGATGNRTITVRFDASLNRAMPWKFEAPEQAVTLPVGESGLAFYRAENLAAHDVVGTATYNVAPDKAGYYFSKIDCFCFTEQKLRPGEAVDMPVSFFIDPEILEDPEMDDVKTITLSYTFFQRPKTAESKSNQPRG
ncbi:MAG: cytochrome c oxidase assembly protein [Rhodobiaceae bacterium]